jgi:hypothetical protein
MFMRELIRKILREQIVGAGIKKGIESSTSIDDGVINHISPNNDMYTYRLYLVTPLIDKSLDVVSFDPTTRRVEIDHPVPFKDNAISVIRYEDMKYIMSSMDNGKDTFTVESKEGPLKFVRIK